MDFGLARSVDPEDSSLTASGQMLGTPAYMAPEQAAAGAIDARADLFSLGCVLYRMSTGESPFARKSAMAMLLAVQNSTPPPPNSLRRDLPQSLSDLIMQMMAKKREDRPASAHEVQQRLADIEATLKPAASTSFVDATVRNRRWVSFTIAGIVVLALIALVLLRNNLWGPNSPAVDDKDRVETPPTVKAEPIQVRFTAKIYKDRGVKSESAILGNGTREIQEGDFGEIEAKLSRPAYGYLVAYYPDGKSKLISAASDDIAPVKSPQRLFDAAVVGRAVQVDAALELCARRPATAAEWFELATAWTAGFQACTANKKSGIDAKVVERLINHGIKDLSQALSGGQKD